ncbi:MAG: hybrid sensor histidine kinase/response regulator [Variovorax sp.]
MTGKATDADGEMSALLAALARREIALAEREAALVAREQAARQREVARRTDAASDADVDKRAHALREANEHLVIAALHADELRETSQLARKRLEDFLAMLSHELRNPLTPISTAVAILRRPDCDEQSRTRLHDVIERHVRHMTRLINDLLDVSRVTHGTLLLQRRPTEVSEFVRQAVETVQEVIDEHRQPLRIELPPEPVYVEGDEVRLVEIVSNLLHNASKYSPDGGAIVVAVERRDDSLLIRVKDHGIGIAPEDLDSVFDLFVQNEQSLDRAQGGLGLGLTIVRAMVELHGGTVSAYSDGKGSGCEFLVMLPGVIDVLPTVETPAQAATASSNARVLVIEDNTAAAAMLAELLRLSGHTVDVAFDGSSGLEMITQAQPQIVVCDIGLPGLTGYEVAQQTREIGQVPPPVLIALTGYGSESDRTLAFKAGFDHFMVKPANLEKLEQLIRDSVGSLHAAS